MRTGSTSTKKREVWRWTFINTCLVELNERLKELESHRHLVEQAKQEKKNLNSELESLKRETLTLKRVKDQLF
jgi:hypothetical protein